MIFHIYTDTLSNYPVQYREDAMDFRVFTRTPLPAAHVAPVAPRHLWGAPRRKSVVFMAVCAFIGGIGARPIGSLAWGAGA